MSTESRAEGETEWFGCEMLGIGHRYTICNHWYKPQEIGKTWKILEEEKRNRCW